MANCANTINAGTASTILTAVMMSLGVSFIPAHLPFARCSRHHSQPLAPQPPVSEVEYRNWSSGIGGPEPGSRKTPAPFDAGAVPGGLPGDRVPVLDHPLKPRGRIGG